MLKSICSGWEFTEKWTEDFPAFEGAAQEVRLPHSVRPLPLNYASPADYEMVCGYRRKLDIPAEYAGKRLFLQFDGAAHIACVYVNGVFAASHRCGYTAFRVEITGLVRPGEDNSVAVKLDCTENGEIPPFGFVIDYLTYGGLYREAWLDVREESYVKDVFVIAGMDRRASVKFEIDGAYEKAAVRILDGESVLAEAEGRDEVSLSVPAARLWDPDGPQLYTCEVALPNGDSEKVSFGFRSVEFRADELLLNGRPYFMRGLNRHQCWPYIGYAAPESLQREDARILSEELQLTAVRTSHYPQSHYFIDECDRRGLLVFTEIPGWQHGVPVPQPSLDHPLGREDQREPGQRRVLHAHQRPGARARPQPPDLRRAVSGKEQPARGRLRVQRLLAQGKQPRLQGKGQGHARYVQGPADLRARRPHVPDQELRHLAAPPGARPAPHARAERRHGRRTSCGLLRLVHVRLRHAQGLRLRQPRVLSRWVLDVGSSMDIGDYPGGETGEIYAFTNAECVELYKNDAYVATFTAKGWKGLKHGPVLIDDKIGDLLRSQEGFEPLKAKFMHDLLLSAEKNGLANLPAADKLKMGAVMLRYGLTMADGVALYGKYVGNWGGEATRWRFDAKVGGRVVASVTRAPGAKLHLECTPSATTLREGDTYDMAAVRVRVLDEYGNPAPYAQLPLHFTAAGAAELASPADAAAEGGMSGCYLRTTGRAGKAVLHVSSPQTASVEIEFSVEK